MNLDTEQFAVTLLRSMSEAVVYADAEGRIQDRNAGAERIFGYTVTDASASRWTTIPRLLRGRHWEGYGRVRPAPRVMAPTISWQAPAMRKDGSRISIEFTVTPFHDQSGRILGIAAIMRDATKRFEEMKALRQRAVATATS